MITAEVEDRIQANLLRNRKERDFASYGGVMRLRIESVDGALVNDYRTCDGAVQVKSLDPSGRPVPGPLGSWRVLETSHIALHHALETEFRAGLEFDLGRPEWLSPRRQIRCVGYPIVGETRRPHRLSGRTL